MAMNRGAKQLATHLIEHGDQARMARKLGFGAALMSRLLKGERLPTALQRARIEDEYPDVFWRFWDEPVSESGEHAAVREAEAS